MDWPSREDFFHVCTHLLGEDNEGIDPIENRKEKAFFQSSKFVYEGKKERWMDMQDNLFLQQNGKKDENAFSVKTIVRGGMDIDRFEPDNVPEKTQKRRQQGKKLPSF